MSIIGSNALAGASGQSTGDGGGGGGGGGGAFNQITRSLRFVSGDSAYLSRTPSSAGNRKKWTWSAWIKRAVIGTGQRIFTGATSTADADWTAIHFVSDQLFISGYNTHYRYSNRLFRDPGAWFHLVVKYDLDAATEAEKIKAWYNGEEITWEYSGTAPATSGINAANNHTLGAEQAPNNGSVSSYCDLYLAEVYFLDGQALAAADFGQLDSNSVWQPKTFAGSYGWFDQSQTWSGLWSTTGTTYGSAAALHDATVSTASYFQIQGSGTFTLSSALPVTSLRFYTQVYGTGGTVSVNGTDVTSQLQSSGIAWSEITGFTSLSTISVTGTDGNNLIGWYAIELNGKLLIDSGITGIADNSFYLDFSDATSTTTLAEDSSGNNNDWTANNLAVGDVDAIYAVFSGSSNQYLRKSGQGVLPGSNGAFTIECHFYPHTTNVIGLFDGGSGQTSIIRNYGNNTIAKQGGGSVSFAGDYTQNAWNHIAVVYTSDNLTVYVNGVSSGTASGLNGFTAGSNFDIGTINGGGDGRFDGFIRNFRVTHSAVYTSGFTAPSHTANLTALTDTKLLALTTAAEGLTGDASTNNYTLTNNGTVTSVTQSDPAATDSFIDTPTNYTAASGNNGGNYCTLNPLKNQSQTLKQGNLVSNGTSGRSTGTLYASSGKFYWEFTAGSSYTMSGIESSTSPQAASYPGENDQQYALYGNNGSGLLYHNGSTSSFDGFVSGDVIGVALDMDGGNLYFYKNGTAMNSGTAAATGLTGAWTANCRSGSGAYNGDTVFNFGQRPFAYTPPTGYVSLCTQNLSDPTIADGSTAMDVALWTGNGSSAQTISTPNLSPDMVWYKERSSTSSHGIVDSVRGATNAAKVLYPDRSDAEATGNATQSITSLNSNGFTIGSSDNSINQSSQTYVGWAWEGGDLATNSAYNQSQIWSDSVTNPNGAYGVASNAFNGDLSTHASPNNANPMTYTNPSASDTVISTFRIYTAIYTTSDIVLELNDTDISDQVTTTTGWQTITGFTNQNFSKLKWAANGNNYEVQLRAIEVNGKILVDSGLIPVGSLNSTVYNQSQTWSGQITGTNYSGYPKTQAFNNDTTDYCLAGQGEELVFTPNPSFSNATTVKIWYYMPTKHANAIKINGTGVADDVSTTGSVATHTFTVSGFTSLSWSRGYYDSEDVGIARIEVDGVQLVDSGISMPSYPAFASTVRANPTAGFSIVQYVSSGTGGRIATGLNATSDIVFIKPTSSTGDWFVYTDVIDGSLDYLKLNATDAKNNSTWTNLLNFSNFITMEGSSAAINSSGVTYSAYCFTSVEGYSSFKAHTVGSGTNFVYLGFRPRLVVLKRTGAGTTTNIAYGSWAMFDTERDTYNEVDFDTILYANRNYAQGKRGDSAGSTAGSYLNIDILSNGIRFQNGAAEFSQPSDKIIVMAWAEHPFKTARAR